MEKAKKIGLISIVALLAAAPVIAYGTCTAIEFIYKWESIYNTRQNAEANLAPGHYKAKLTLANGSVVIPDSAPNGKLVTQGRTPWGNRPDGTMWRLLMKGSYHTHETQPFTYTVGGKTVTIIVKGTRIRTTANKDGEFDLNGVDVNAKLIFNGVPH